MRMDQCLLLSNSFLDGFPKCEKRKRLDVSCYDKVYFCLFKQSVDKRHFKFNFSAIVCVSRKSFKQDRLEIMPRADRLVDR